MMKEIQIRPGEQRAILIITDQRIRVMAADLEQILFDHIIENDLIVACDF